MIAGSSQWTWSIPPWRAAVRIAASEVVVGEPEVVDHERLEGRDAGLDQGRQLADRVVLLAADAPRTAR